MVAVGASVPDESGPAPVEDAVPVADHRNALPAGDARAGGALASTRGADACSHGLTVRGPFLVAVAEQQPDDVTVHVSAGEPIVSDLERLREENAALRRSLLLLRGVYDMAATMRKRGYPPEDVLCHIEEGINAAVGEITSREAVS